jgi:hypothetical protein
MKFPKGPLRNAGDLRLAVALSAAWILGAGIYAFLINPPPRVGSSLIVAVSICADKADTPPSPTAVTAELAMVHWQTDRGFQECFPEARRIAFEIAHHRHIQEIVGRVALLLLPPLGALGALWLLVSTVGWVRRGYTG